MRDDRESDLVRAMADQLRGTMEVTVPSWEQAQVQFRAVGGGFSTSVSFTAPGGTRPLDALHHRALFVRLQDMGRRLHGATGHSASGFTVCEVVVAPQGTHGLRISGEHHPGQASPPPHELASPA